MVSCSSLQASRTVRPQEEACSSTGSSLMYIMYGVLTPPNASIASGGGSCFPYSQMSGPPHQTRGTGRYGLTTVGVAL